MRSRSIRFRLTLWYAAALTLGLGVFGGLIWLSLRQRLIVELDRDLAGRSARFEQYFRGESVEAQGDQLRDELDEFCQALPPASYVDLRGSDGFQFHYPASAASPSAAPQARTGPARPPETSGTRDQPAESGSVVPASSLEAGAGPARSPKPSGTRDQPTEPGSVVRASPLETREPMLQRRMLERRFAAGGQEFDLEVGAPMENVVHTLQLLRLLLWSLLPVVIVLACAGGAWLSGRALKPIQDLTAAASAIGIENLSERLPAPATGDELARLTEVLNSMLARLEAALKRLSQFAADASHELRTPLAVIRTTAELALRRSRTPESYRESLAEIAVETERMTQLIEDLLTLARGGTEAVEMPRTSLDLRALVREVCTELHSLAESRQVRIDAVGAESGQGPAIVSGNRPALRRLFVILLDNALKYSPAGAEVRLRLSQEGGRVAVSIEDSGAGISATDLPHIFERFYRAGAGSDKESRSQEGHGLGLALADHIARAHGATIEVRSTEGASSVFRVSLAAAASANLQIAAIS
jgi:heavy metal sensor kinase